MKNVLQVLVALVLAAVPILPRALDEGGFALDGVVLVILAAVVPRTKSRWLAGLFGGLWALLVLFEVGMYFGRGAMGEEPVLWDGLQLVRHLGVLTADLYGQGVVLTALGAGALALAGAFGLVSLAFSWFLGEQVRGRVLIPALLFCGLAALGSPTSATFRAVDSTVASLDLLRRVGGIRVSGAHDVHMAMRLEKQPDVRIYILESYGMVAYRGTTARRWEGFVRQHASRMEGSGWSLAAVRSRAPTSGGRSWICDASLLSGRQIRFQAEYEAYTADTDPLDALPEWFATQGYETVLARPVDRKRPGVELQNRFGFERTVFFDDLGYRGPRVGWGFIPDRYTVLWLHDNVFGPAERPQFSFTHLATAHYPWRAKPIPWAETWQDYNEADIDHALGKGSDFNLSQRFWLLARQFRRDPNQRKRELDHQAAYHYQTSLEHGLRAIVDELTKIPADRPTLAIILGDHQPPFLAPRGYFGVPVHIAANDPGLVELFLEEGAREGWSPRRAPMMRHAGLYTRIVRALAAYDGQEPPPDLPDGVLP